MTAFLEHAGQPVLNSVSGAMIQVWVERLAAVRAPSSVARKPGWAVRRGLASLKSLLTFGVLAQRPNVGRRLDVCQASEPSFNRSIRCLTTVN